MNNNTERQGKFKPVQKVPHHMAKSKAQLHKRVLYVSLNEAFK